jgi:uncharacterized protein
VSDPGSDLDTTPVTAPGRKPDGWTPPGPSGEAAWSPPAIHVLGKPTGAICNLGCSYCFFLDKELLYAGDRFRMSDDVLERFVVQLIEAHRTPEVTIAWQGGEPTLMGLDFFRRGVEIAERHRKPGMSFLHTIQTNGTLLDDEWCAFLAEHGFLVGISIDGPRHLHDAYRVDKRGDGSFDKVMRGLRLLQRHGVEYNVLTTVNRVNGDHPLDVYRFLRDEVGTTWMQFIPVVERVDADGEPADLRGTEVSERSVRPEQFGTFLSTVFDEWVRHDVGTVFVQTFEAAANNWAGTGNSGMCVFNETCGLGLALEHNGDLYSCDHFVHPDHLLGNITQTHMGDLVATRQQYEFGQAKRDTLPRYCLECDVRFACHGESPKNRFTTTPDGEPGLNYLCAGFKHFFHHVDRPMRMMIDLMRSGRYAADVMDLLDAEDREFARSLRRAGRNGPCPCGSGRKVKQCHGAAGTASGGEPAEESSAVEPDDVGAGVPRPRVVPRRPDAQAPGATTTPVSGPIDPA